MAGCNIWNSLHETNGKYENLNSMKSRLDYYRTTYYRCSYIVNSVHEYFAVTDSHLQISQHQASLKHENFTESYHSYTTLLPQNIVQIQLHFSCTPCSINKLRFTKIRGSWNGGLPLHVPNWKMLLTLPKFEWGSFHRPKIWFGLLESVQMFPRVCKFKLSSCILPKMKWSCLKFYKAKFNEAVWSYPKLNEDVPLCPNLNGDIGSWPELI